MLKYPHLKNLQLKGNVQQDKNCYNKINVI